MELKVTPAAVQWFESELGPKEGQGVQFFGKVYGQTEVHEGFSVGIKIQDPAKHDILAQDQANGRTYFAARDDAWFFNPYDLEVDIDPDGAGPVYHFKTSK